MKILYSAGKRPGANLLLQRFASRYTEGTLRIAAYQHASLFLPHLDWTLDALDHPYCGNPRQKIIDLLGRKNLPRMALQPAQKLLQEIEAYQPDLVICDYEPIVANMAYSLGCRLWYYSPVHLLDGFAWGQNQRRYFGSLEVTRKNLAKLPPAEKKLVCSPFALFGDAVKPGYQWVVPASEDYQVPNSGGGLCLISDPDRLSELSKILNCISPYDLVLYSTHRYNLSHLESYLLEEDSYCQAVGACDWMFLGGESVFLMDGIANQTSKFCIAPKLSDPESLLNAILLTYYGLGDDLGQVEYLKYLSVEEIEQSYHQNLENPPAPTLTGVPTLLDEVLSADR